MRGFGQEARRLKEGRSEVLAKPVFSEGQA